jgi:predicted MFS family arabinose efflux permease
MHPLRLTSPDRLLRRLLLILAMTAGVSIANIYYNQPLLDSFRQSFPHHAAWVGAVPTATQIGFAMGMLLLAPLGDRVDRRRLILIQTACICVALLIAATASTLPVLICACLAIGIFATAAQQAGPFATELVPASHRGHAIGTVMSGLLLGILLARTASGFVTGYFGWRWVFAAAIASMLALAVMIVKYLPASRPTSTLSYGKLLISLWRLTVELRGLREAALTGASLFAAFSLFWSVLSLLLARPPFYLGPQVAGLFGIVGVAGALTAPYAGKFADRRGPRTAISLAIALVTLSFAIFSVSGSSIAGLVLGVIVLDVGLQFAQTPNQSRVFALKSDARSRINTVYMTCYFTGGAAGSAAGALAWQAFGWIGACIAGLLFCVVAAGSHFWGRRHVS